MTTNAQPLEDLIRDFLVANGNRPVTDVRGVARLTSRSISTVRRAYWRGELVGSRNAKNGPLRFTLREAARWMLDGQRRSLPM